MKPLNVNFAPRRQLPAWLWIGLTLALLGFAAYEAWQAWGLTQQLRAAEHEAMALASKLEQARINRQAAVDKANIPPPYAKDAELIARMASFPLDQVLKSIESVRIEGIRVSALDVSTVDGAVKLDLEFNSNEVLMRYLEELNAGEPQPRWRLLQAQAGSSTSIGGTASITSVWEVIPISGSGR